MFTECSCVNMNRMYDSVERIRVCSGDICAVHVHEILIRFAPWIMEISTFFLCFLITESFAHSLIGFREKSPLKVNDALRVIEELREGKFEKVFQLLENDYSRLGYGANTEATEFFYQSSFVVTSKLEDMTNIFMKWTSLHIIRHLREYCVLAIEVLPSNSNGDVNYYVREKIRFLDEHEYCIITAIYNWDNRYLDTRVSDLLFESLHFLQTFNPHTDIIQLKDQLRLLRDKCDNIFTRTNAEWIQIFREPLKSLKDYREAMTSIENEITDFSQKFCSSWKPFARLNLLPAGTQLNDVQNQCPFIRHVFQNEICKITIRWIKYIQEDPNRLLKSNNRAEDQQYHMVSWSCKKILDSKKYRYQENLPAPIGSCVKKFIKKIAKQPSSPLNPFSTGKSKEKNINFSLAALKNAIKSNSYYLNVVAYYNIMADVMLMVSIREGNTILIGIRLVVQRNYIKKTDQQCVRKMRELRSTLFEFKSVFDDLVFLILNEKRLIIKADLQIKSFNDRVNSVLQLLDIQNDRNDQIDQIYSGIPKQLKGLKGDPYYLTDDWNEFQALYFTESILNITKLYSFSVNNF